MKKKVDKKVVFEENKTVDLKKQQLIDEMKNITLKINQIEKSIHNTFNCVYVLVSKDDDQLVHLHGIYTTLDKGSLYFKKISDESDKYSKIVKISKIILYKVSIDQIDTSFDTSLLDDCEHEIIMKKEYQNDTLYK